jgi:hypothetical protein
MSAARHLRQRTDPAPAIGLLVVRGLILLAVIGCLGMLGIAGKWLADWQALRAAAEAYLSELDAGRIEDAYARTTRNFQMNQDFHVYQPAVSRSLLRRQGSRSYSHVGVYRGPAGPEGIVLATVHGPDHSLPITLILIKEDGQWKIDRWYDSWD